MTNRCSFPSCCAVQLIYSFPEDGTFWGDEVYTVPVLEMG
jgi:hypothetical protein